MYYYEVAPTKIVRPDQAVFTYHYDSRLAKGQLVVVPVGKQQLVGIIMAVVKRPVYATKPLAPLPLPTLPWSLVATAEWIASYYSSHLALVLQAMLPRGITKKRREGVHSSSLIHRNRTNFVLNKSQQKAVEAFLTMSPGTGILHGVTGSGKTAVYIELVRDCLRQGKSALVLVPEIALTSQLVADFTNHFATVLVSHSAQTEAERHRLWTHILQSTEPVVIIGPRSILFSPVKSLGTIIIDEAHEPSYRQDQSPKYSALRVASVLATQHNARVVQGTATPLVSELYLARAAGRPVVSLPQIAQPGAVKASASLVDITKRSSFGSHRFLSQLLLKQVESTLKDGKQVLIFHNRRGSASITLCEECGWSALCDQCTIPMTLHGDLHKLICHICAKAIRVPTSCPQCHHTNIIHRGIGTKLIESELRKLFPSSTIARFDGDSTSDATLAKSYQSVYDGTIDIIVGTQVIAKGLDLPHLRTVGVVQADAGLALPDYAASERTFQLLSQVVGRVGRSSHATSVIVQSYQPDAPAVQLGIMQDYERFYDYELARRRHDAFPPFIFLLKLTCVYKTESSAVKHAAALAHALRENYPDVSILGPVPAFYEFQHNTYRWQLLIKSTSRSKLLALTQTVPMTHWYVDIDPPSLL